MVQDGASTFWPAQRCCGTEQTGWCWGGLRHGEKRQGVDGQREWMNEGKVGDGGEDVDDNDDDGHGWSYCSSPSGKSRESTR
jgi:hypothetical protein